MYCTAIARPAVRLDDTILSYRALEERSARAAGLLEDRGVWPGDRVAIILQKMPELVMIYYGVLRAVSGRPLVDLVDDLLLDPLRAAASKPLRRRRGRLGLRERARLEAAASSSTACSPTAPP